MRGAESILLQSALQDCGLVNQEPHKRVGRKNRGALGRAGLPRGGCAGADSSSEMDGGGLPCGAQPARAHRINHKTDDAGDPSRVFFSQPAGHCVLTGVQNAMISENIFD